MKQLTIRSISFILAMALIMVMIPTASAYGKISSWAEEEVNTMEDLGLLPDSLDNADLTSSITRLDMCRIAVLSYESLTGNTIPEPPEHPFSDTADSDVEKAYWAGLVNGRTDGKFYPDEYLTRVEFFAFVSQFLTAVGYPTTGSDYADISEFSDANTLPKWAKEETQLAVGLEIVKGDSGALKWSNNTTAEQAILMFCRAYDAASQVKLDPPALKSPDPYEDLSGWAEGAVMEMEDMGLVPDGVKYRSMRDTITRADMCRIAVNTYKRIFGIGDEMNVSTSPFSDVNDVDISTAQALGIVNGYEDGTFRPNNPLTRQEFFKITQNFLLAIGYLHSDDDMIDLNEYSDGSKVSNYAVAPIRVLLALGIVTGSSDSGTIYLHPTEQIISQEALTVFYRAYDFAMTWTDEDNTTDTPVEDDRTDEDLTVIEKVIKLAKEIEANDNYWYVWGGNDPSDGGFDCSGFVYYVYKEAAGITNLYQPCSNQWNTLGGWSTVIDRNELLPGDLLFFWNSSKTDFQHVGMYIGDGKMVHASNSRTGIIISDIDEPYYLGRYMGAQRVIK